MSDKQLWGLESLRAIAEMQALERNKSGKPPLPEGRVIKCAPTAESSPEWAPEWTDDRWLRLVRDVMAKTGRTYSNTKQEETNNREPVQDM